jgi:hypothetical protein
MWHLNQQIFILPKEKGGLNDESGNLFPVEGHQTPLQTIYFLAKGQSRMDNPEKLAT